MRQFLRARAWSPTLVTRCGVAILGAVALVMVACAKVEHLLEGPVPLDARLSMAIDSTSVTCPKGASRSISVAVTRVGEYNGAVTLTVEQLPTGVTAVVDNERTVGAVTTARVTLTAGPTATAAVFAVLVRAHADRLSDENTQISLTITPPLDFTLSSSLSAATIARGGQAAVNVTLNRINFGAPVTLSLEGDTHITAAFGENPLTVSSTTTRLAVAANTPVGTYPMVWRARGDGVTDRTVAFSVSVTDDALQVLAVPSLSVAQGGSAQTVVIVNRVAALAEPTLSVESLPVGVTAALAPTVDGTSQLVFRAGPDALPGSTRVTVRASANGVTAGAPSASADVQLTVLPASIALTLGASGLDVFQGASARVSAKITRSAYTGDVVYALEGAPTGLSLQATPDAIDGNLTSLAIAATSATPVGVHAVTVRAQPTSLNASAAQRATLSVTVRPTSANGNVLLDWSSCTPPSWVAAQDGTGAWQPLAPVNGTFRFSVNTDRGAFAYVDDGTTIVRHLLQSELTAGPIAMCPVIPPVKSIRGTSSHTAIGEVWTYSLGGAVAQTTIAQPNFTLSGVAYGTQDLVGWAPYNTVFHALLRRDLNVPDGEPLDQTISMVGPESFTVARTTMTITNALNESLSHTMSYLTTSACTVNPLYALGPHGLTPQVWGIPEQFQRPTDYHYLVLSSFSTTSRRSISLSFRQFAARQIDLPPQMPIPGITPIAGPMKRFRMALGSLPAVFNETIEFRYGDGLHSMRLIASTGYVGTQNLSLTAPDFSNVGEFPASAVISPTATGTWSMTVTGASLPGSRCQDNRSAVSSQRLGTY